MGTNFVTSTTLQKDCEHSAQFEYYLSSFRLPLQKSNMHHFLYKAVLAWIFFSILATIPAAANAVTSVELKQMKPTNQDLKNPSLDLLVLTITEVQGGEQLPLEATVRIKAVFRSRNLHPGEMASATWGFDSSGRRYERPDLGTNFLAIAKSAALRDGTNKLIILDTFSPSPENLQVVQRYMADLPNSGLSVILTPLVAWLLLLGARVSSSALLRWILVLTSLLAGLATIVLYYFYEESLTYHYNIRLDVFILWPAVLLGATIPIGLWWFFCRQEQKEAVQ